MKRLIWVGWWERGSLEDGQIWQRVTGCHSACVGHTGVHGVTSGNCNKDEWLDWFRMKGAFLTAVQNWRVLGLLRHILMQAHAAPLPLEQPASTRVTHQNPALEEIGASKTQCQELNKSIEE